MSNNITVYWACLEDETLRAKEPQPIYNKILLKESTKNSGLLFCPGFKDYTKNIFGLQSLYDYEFTIENNQVFSKTYDQNFYDIHMVVRSIEDKLFSFCQRFIFFTEEDELLMSANMQPFFEENSISERCMLVPGTFDIGKWFRNIDFAFYLKNNFNTFNINEGDIFQYIKFHTNKKIIFKQFYMDDFLEKQYQNVLDSKKNREPGVFRNLSSYYSLARNKKNIIKAIKKNIIKD